MPATLRRYYDRIPPVILAVIASTFFVGFGGGVIFPILPNLGAFLGISAFMVGLILSANRFVRLVANAPAGALVDRYGTRKPFVYGLLIEGIATLGYVVAVLLPDPERFAYLAVALPTIDLGPVFLGTDQWFWLIAGVVAPETWFMIARILWGLGSAAVFATAYTIAADVSPAESRGTNMGVVRGGLLLGFPAGMVLGGVVSAVAGEAIAFGLAAAFAGFASVVAYVYVPETHVTDSTYRSSVKPWDIETAIPAVTVGLVNFGMMFTYLGALFATLVLFLDARSMFVFGLGAQGTSGIFMAGTVVAAGISMLIGGRISDQRASRVPVLMGCLALFVIGFFLLARTGTLAELIVACLFIGIGQGGTSGPMMALLADLMPDERMGRAAGTNNVLGDVGGGLGPMISLPLVEIVGFTPIYIACAFVPMLAGAILLFGLKKETGTMLPGHTTSN